MFYDNLPRFCNGKLAQNANGTTVSLYLVHLLWDASFCESWRSHTFKRHFDVAADPAVHCGSGSVTWASLVITGGGGKHPVSQQPPTSCLSAPLPTADVFVFFSPLPPLLLLLSPCHHRPWLLEREPRGSPALRITHDWLSPYSVCFYAFRLNPADDQGSQMWEMPWFVNVL